MILSKVMAEKDYDALESEGRVINTLHDAIQMWYPYQHRHRLWEYALAQKALKTVYGDKKNLVVSDHGCGCGYLSPIMYWLGHTVYMYECWSFGDTPDFMMEQMRKVSSLRSEKTGTYEMRNRPLGGLVEQDKGVDAAFCISTLEHIRDYQAAFRDLIGTVKLGGLAFLTTDFGEHENDTYVCSNLRAGKMFTQNIYFELLTIAESMGFELLDDEDSSIDTIADWEWKEENRLVNDYGFASMALRREE
jgi:2-polyprenyl-3-methyl-5-hydroxy-6-metoxy-1,4-benzoquinol methylase